MKQIGTQLELVRYMQDNGYSCPSISCSGTGKVIADYSGRKVQAINTKGVPCPFQENCGHMPRLQSIESMVMAYLKERI